MRIPPSPTGSGGSQRAWLLVEALRQLGPIDVVLVHRETDGDLATVSLEPLRARVDSLTVIPLRSWGTTKLALPLVPWRLSVWLDQLRIGSAEAPRLGRRTLCAIADRLPSRDYDLVFAGRLPCAVIADDLFNAGLITARTRVVDFDDIISRFKKREIAANKRGLAPDALALARLDLLRVRRAEQRIGASWDATSVCTQDDANLLAAAVPAGLFRAVPNVVERPQLPLVAEGDPVVLFVGNLGFPPNLQGLELFITDAWPRIRARQPRARLTVVGLAPPASLAKRIAAGDDGVSLHANVPSVEPYYKQANLVICPITFGGGTRIKLLEAMAYGRPVVSTTIGAEGLGLVDGCHALIRDDMVGFADAVIRLGNDAALQCRLAQAARNHQVEAFGFPVMRHALDDLIAAAQARRKS